MTYQLIITEEAERGFGQILTYLEANWSEKVCRTFVQTYQQKLRLVSQNPLMYPKAEGDDNLRRCVLTKQSLMYYSVDEVHEIVEILLVVDARSNPEHFPS